MLHVAGLPQLCLCPPACHPALTYACVRCVKVVAESSPQLLGSLPAAVYAALEAATLRRARIVQALQPQLLAAQTRADLFSRSHLSSGYGKGHGASRTQTHPQGTRHSLQTFISPFLGEYASMHTGVPTVCQGCKTLIPASRQQSRTLAICTPLVPALASRTMYPASAQEGGA